MEQLESRPKELGLRYVVDSFEDGISFGQHRPEPGSNPRELMPLAIEDQGRAGALKSRYALHVENSFWELERYLLKLSRQGQLGASTLFFGVDHDPFLPFEETFDASMKFLQLFERYTPGMLHVQTRSPLIVLAMPILKRLGNRAAVTMALETSDEETVRHYTPHLPRVEDRLRAALALKRLGVEVTLQVSPVLPYGDWRKDAKEFASLLDAHSDYVTVGSLCRAEDSHRRATSTLAKRLAFDRKFHWLRPDAANPLLHELKSICPHKLELPVRAHLTSRQLSIFAA